MDNLREGDRTKALWMFKGMKVRQSMHLNGIHYIYGQGYYLSASYVKEYD